MFNNCLVFDLTVAMVNEPLLRLHLLFLFSLNHQAASLSKAVFPVGRPL